MMHNLNVNYIMLGLSENGMDYIRPKILQKIPRLPSHLRRKDKYMNK
jgi:hypothetical protein